MRTGSFSVMRRIIRDLKALPRRCASYWRLSLRKWPFAALRLPIFSNGHFGGPVFRRADKHRRRLTDAKEPELFALRDKPGKRSRRSDFFTAAATKIRRLQRKP